jgi:hypothetical protein
MTDEELKIQIIKKYIIPSQIIIWKQEIMYCMEEWAGIISKRTEDSLIDEMGFGDDPDRFSNSLDDVFKNEL